MSGKNSHSARSSRARSSASGSSGGHLGGGGTYGNSVNRAGRDNIRRSYGSGRDSGEKVKGVVDVVTSVVGLINPVAGLAAKIGAWGYGQIKGLTADSYKEKSFAEGFSAGPERTGVEHLVRAGLAVAPFAGLSGGAVGVGKVATDMMAAGRQVGGVASAGLRGSGGSGPSLGAWTSKTAVKNTIKKAGFSATDAEISAITKAYNAKNIGGIRKSAPLSTRPDRYRYLTRGGKS